MTFSTLDVVKRNEEGKTIVLWDAASPCHGDGCPISHLCSFKDKADRCTVETQYITAAVSAIITANDLTEAQVHHAGTVLMPLYSHLVKFKLVELSLEQPLITAKKGHAIMHPIYKEIRETIKTINKVWTDLFKAQVKTKEPNLDDLLEHGDHGYVERLYNRDKKGLPRRH